MESLHNNQKEPATFFFIIKTVNFLNEHLCVCSVSSFLWVISTSTKIVDLYYQLEEHQAEMKNGSLATLKQFCN